MDYSDKMESLVNFYNFFFVISIKFFVCVYVREREREFFDFMLGTQANTAFKEPLFNYKSKKYISRNSGKLIGSGNLSVRAINF